MNKSEQIEFILNSNMSNEEKEAILSVIAKNMVKEAEVQEKVSNMSNWERKQYENKVRLEQENPEFVKSQQEHMRDFNLKVGQRNLDSRTDELVGILSHVRKANGADYLYQVKELEKMSQWDLEELYQTIREHDPELFDKAYEEYTNEKNNKVAEEPVAEETVQPVVEEPVAEETVQPVVEEPVAEETVQPVVEEPVVEETVQPVVEEPVIPENIQQEDLPLDARDTVVIQKPELEEQEEGRKKVGEIKTANQDLKEKEDTPSLARRAINWVKGKLGLEEEEFTKDTLVEIMKADGVPEIPSETNEINEVELPGDRIEEFNKELEQYLPENQTAIKR